mgnify:CR=1 FL=1|eukprot:scaffold206478_cov33-Tisochrysis_lutea.AAC.3
MSCCARACFAEGCVGHREGELAVSRAGLYGGCPCLGVGELAEDDLVEFSWHLVGDYALETLQHPFVDELFETLLSAHAPSQLILGCIPPHATFENAAVVHVEFLPRTHPMVGDEVEEGP